MKTTIVSACLAAALPSLVAGHGYMIIPKAQLPTSGDPTRYVTEVRGSTILPVPEGGSFSNSPQINVDSFTKAFKASSYKSLKEFIEKKSPSTPSCGLTPAGGEPQDVPDQVQYSSFPDSHVGPCEVWCDNTRVFQEDNCAGKYTTKPVNLPINKAGCANAKQLKFIWLALHSQDWQIYISCAPLKGTGQTGGSSGGNNGGNSGSNTPSVTPTPANTTPKPPSPAPAPASNGNKNNSSSGGGKTDDDCDQDLPEPSGGSNNNNKNNGGGNSNNNSGGNNTNDEDCDQDLPEPDCEDDLPVAGNEADEYGFDALQRGNKYTPGKAHTN